MEESVQSQNVWVSEVLLDLYLSSDLFLDLGLDELRLVERLESEDVSWLAFGAYHVHAPKLALAERTTDLEITEGPVSCRPLAGEKKKRQ